MRINRKESIEKKKRASESAALIKSAIVTKTLHDVISLKSLSSFHILAATFLLINFVFFFWHQNLINFKSIF